MKMHFKKSIVGAALLCLCFTVSAQVATNTDQIYSTAKEAYISFTAIVQTTNGGTTRVRVANKEIIAALNATGVFNFTNSPKLYMRSDNAALPYFMVRDSGTNEFDVSDYLTVVGTDDAVHGRNSKINWAMWDVTFSGGDLLDFEFWSLTTLHTGQIRIGKGGFLERTIALSSVGSGPGHINGEDAQFTGTIIANHAVLDNLSITKPTTSTNVVDVSTAGGGG